MTPQHWNGLHSLTHTHSHCSVACRDTFVFLSSRSPPAAAAAASDPAQRSERQSRETETVHCLSAYHAFSCLRVEKKGDVSGDCIIRLGSVSCRRCNLKQMGRERWQICVQDTPVQCRHAATLCLLPLGRGSHRDHKATLPFFN